MHVLRVTTAGALALQNHSQQTPQLPQKRKKLLGRCRQRVPLFGIVDPQHTAERVCNTARLCSARCAMSAFGQTHVCGARGPPFFLAGAAVCVVQKTVCHNFIVHFCISLYNFTTHFLGGKWVGWGGGPRERTLGVGARGSGGRSAGGRSAAAMLFARGFWLSSCFISGVESRLPRNEPGGGKRWETKLRNKKQLFRFNFPVIVFNGLAL